MQALSQLSYSPTRRRMLQQPGAAARKSFGPVSALGRRGEDGLSLPGTGLGRDRPG